MHAGNTPRKGLGGAKADGQHVLASRERSEEANPHAHRNWPHVAMATCWHHALDQQRRVPAAGAPECGCSGGAREKNKGKPLGFDFWIFGTPNPHVPLLPWHKTTRITKTTV